MTEFLIGWKAALRMVKEEAERYKGFIEYGLDIHDKKSRELPANLKELDKLLWKAFRAGQAEVGKSICSHIEYHDVSQYCEDE